MKPTSPLLAACVLCLFSSSLCPGAVTLPSGPFSESGSDNVERPQDSDAAAHSPEPAETARHEPSPAVPTQTVTPKASVSKNPDGKVTQPSSPEMNRKTVALADAYEEALKAEPNSKRQKELFGEVFERSLEILRKEPDAVAVWLVRANAALRLDESKIGWEAGQNLIRLGLDKSQSQMVKTTLAQMERKKWLENAAPDVAGQSRQLFNRELEWIRNAILNRSIRVRGMAIDSQNNILEKITHIDGSIINVEYDNANCSFRINVSDTYKTFWMNLDLMKLDPDPVAISNTSIKITTLQKRQAIGATVVETKYRVSDKKDYKIYYRFESNEAFIFSDNADGTHELLGKLTSVIKMSQVNGDSHPTVFDYSNKK